MAKDDFVDFLSVQIGTLEQLARGVAREIDGAHVLQDSARFTERRSDAGDNRHTPSVKTRH